MRPRGLLLGEIGRATDTGSRLVGTVEQSEQRGTKRTTWAAGDLACHRVQQPPQPTLARTGHPPTTERGDSTLVFCLGFWSAASALLDWRSRWARSDSGGSLRQSESKQVVVNLFRATWFATEEKWMRENMSPWAPRESPGGGGGDQTTLLRCPALF